MIFVTPKLTMITSDISLVKDQLEKGEVVGIPTETVYGLAANIYDEQAIAKIFSTKGRPNTNPLIVHETSLEQARTLVSYFPPIIKVGTEISFRRFLMSHFAKEPPIPNSLGPCICV